MNASQTAADMETRQSVQLSQSAPPGGAGTPLLPKS